MCKHCFIYPEDRWENYNPDNQTLTGHCRCGVTKKAYGMQWSIPVCEEIQAQNKQIELRVIDNYGIIW